MEENIKQYECTAYAKYRVVVLAESKEIAGVRAEALFVGGHEFDLATGKILDVSDFEIHELEDDENVESDTAED